MSAILLADDLNDFISPGVACIKPVEVKPTEAGEVEIQIDENGNPLEISKIDGKISALAPAQISLADCLACSGCITSAEEVLVAQHSHDELLKALAAKDRTFVASISHQLRASLAHAYGYTVAQMDRLLVKLLESMGFKYVVGTALGRKLLLLQEAVHMIERKKQGAKSPVLSSICPGWVLYAEKTHPEVLTYMSTVKSPQQITGLLLKTLVSQELAVPRDKIYHLSIMPCFDKKLESARPEALAVASSLPDVDCVLTAKELVNMLEASGHQLVLENAVQIANDRPDLYTECAPERWPFKELSWANDSGSESGGYAYNYLQLLKNHFVTEGYKPGAFDLVRLEGKNSDIYELHLMYDGNKIASAAVVNGFRNIQNLVRRLKPSGKKTNPLVARRRARMAKDSEEQVDAAKCDYVEIMACPGGCINGGGQISSPTQQEQEWMVEVQQVYETIRSIDLDNDLAVQLANWSNDFCTDYGVPVERLYETHFSEVEKPTDANAILMGATW